MAAKVLIFFLISLTINEPEQVLVAPDGFSTVQLYRSQIMSTHVIATLVNRKAKLDNIRNIIKELGEDASQIQIMAKVEAEGWGRVSVGTIARLRDELWPDRQKLHNNNANRYIPTRMVSIVGPDPRTLCPSCGSDDTRSIRTYQRVAGERVTYRRCGVCKKKYTTHGQPRRIDDRRRRAMGATHKECSRCKQLLPISSFGKKCRDADLYRPACNPCMAEVRRLCFGKRSIRKQYGITPEKYLSMIDAQDGKCAICGGHNPEASPLRRLSIDHCHKANKVRGLLCSKCNLAIGNFQDDVGLLKAAIAYLQAHEAREEVTYAQRT